MFKYIILLSTLLSFNVSAVDVKTYIPTNAYQYLPLVKTETDRIFPEIPIKAYPAALAEHESCIHLKHSRCWNPKSELRTKREFGVGFGQITKAYKEDGSIRFDSLTDMVRIHNKELKELSWSNITTRPDLQIRAMLLMSKGNYKELFKVADPIERLKMTDLAYNAGLGRVNKNRMQCRLSKNCDTQLWDNNVELHCTASKRILYGNRSACDIMKHHVNSVMYERLPKYKPYFN